LLGARTAEVDVTEHVYATDGTKQLKLDLYRAHAGDPARPLILIIHGGSWKGGNRKQLPALNHYLAQEGYAVASIDYRHAPKSQFPAAVDDVFRALEFLETNAAALRIDAKKVVVLGRSAGGQIALSAAYAQRSHSICGVVALYAPTDLMLGYEKPSRPAVLDSKSVLEAYLGGTPAQKPDLYAAASPVTNVRSNTPPTLLVQGALDPIVWPIHSELLDTQLEAAGRPHLLLRLPWATHGLDANLSGPSGQLSTYAIDRFVANVLPLPTDSFE
jgi:acetyl esterase/lipase